jgi:hypothetical protein
MKHLGLHLFAEENFAGLDATDRDDDLFAGFLFHDVAAAAGAQRAFGVKRFVVHREDKHEHVRVTGLDVFDELDAVAGLEGDIDDGDIGRECADEFESLCRSLPPRRPRSCRIRR